MMHKGMTGRIGPASVKPDVTLKDYIERKQVGEKKKLTFEEWYSQSGWAARHEMVSLDDADSCKYIMSLAWKAAQENV